MGRLRNMVSSMPEHAAVVVPHDSTNMDFDCAAIYVGGDGNVAAVTIHNEVVTFTGMSAGDVLPCKAKRINDTNTTATLMIALW